MVSSDAEASARPVGEHCLSFVVEGDWAHFRRIEGNIVKQTYRIIPRTTVAGMIAAMLGLSRDSYYDLFRSNRSAIAIQPLRTLRTVNVPINCLSTAGSDIQMCPSRGHARVGLVDPSTLRQQHNYEFLVDPSYRIDLWLDDTDIYDRIRDHLESGTSEYVPSLGLSECLASIEYLGEFRIEDGPADTTVSVDSAVIDAVDSVHPEADRQVRVERSPGFMKADPGGRTTSGFLSVAYARSADPLTASGVRTSSVDGRTVMFS